MRVTVVSTINGDANVPFYKELGNQGAEISADALVKTGITSFDSWHEIHRNARIVQS